MDDLNIRATEFFAPDRGLVLDSNANEAEHGAKIRRETGRYTLEEAAYFVHQVGQARAHSILNGLLDAIALGALAIHEPRLNGRYKTDVVRPWRDEAYWSDLNAWLEINEPLIGPIFPSPDNHNTEVCIHAPSPTTSLPNKTVRLRNNHLDAAIDRAIERAGNMNLADVYLSLNELALSEFSPFTGVIESGELFYTNTDGAVTKLTRSALAKRLKRRREGRR